MKNKKTAKDNRKTNGGYRPGSGPKKKAENDKKTTINFSISRALVNTPETRKALKDFVYDKIEEYSKIPLIEVEQRKNIEEGSKFILRSISGLKQPHELKGKVEKTNKKPVEGKQLPSEVLDLPPAQHNNMSDKLKKALQNKIKK